MQPQQGRGNLFSQAWGKATDWVKSQPALNTPLASSLGSLRQNYQQGNHLGSWFDLMQTRRLADQSGSADSLSPLFEAQGGWAPTAWDASGWVNRTIGTPQQFAGVLGGFAPGLMRGVGSVAGLPGLIGLHGLASGNRGVFQDMRTIAPWIPKFGSADLIDRLVG